MTISIRPPPSDPSSASGMFPKSSTLNTEQKYSLNYFSVFYRFHVIRNQHFEVGFTEEIVETMEWDNHNPNIQLGELDKIGNIPEN